ncbi:guanine deaminase [Thauera linaloolentis]|uniref:Guanine deaminase n=1 Tax=Thauera linaloolentis (strain DSM 12138 / JCM 21573 / CCUG 41526 / CIP 105981 / IAM 15112 / NBRC 102519 / 47Lol) TaxID=1123367 RepID=N6YT71_THAL4|nr:guanine deaminase [Thauera linaloolentis]ENO85353.1 guanine deaminase [Thauera linaloolentis 47Lol = DSM 12138]MCM8567663.1 guanine deaminase [Thauera linaloolentis]
MSTTDALPLRAVRGEILHFLSDPAEHGAAAWQHFGDGILAIRDGCVAELGPAQDMLAKLPSDIALDDHRGKLVLPGFVDTHIHYAQTDIIASHGEQLLAWLEKYTFPAEARFADPVHAAATADFFCDELLRNGTTTAMAFATVHAASAEALFAAALRRRMRLITGKVLMDRNCPEELRDTAQAGDAESRALIARWHGRERLLYAVTPRFAGTSTRGQMQRAGRLFAEHPDLHLQSHLAENRGEVEWIARLYPEARSYLDVYDRFGQLGERSIYAHCIWLDRADRERMAATGSAMSFCPSSNLFLGSGLFDLAQARALGVRVGIGTDVGAGTSFSMLQTLGDAYKVLQLAGQRLSAASAFHLATLGGARSLYLDGRIGNFLPGREADFVVLDPQATPLMARRMAGCASLDERLFVLMMLGDDRAVAATHVMGEPAWRRGAPPPD